MHIPYIVYARVVLAALVSFSCIVGDYLLETTRHPLLKALCDNATHAIVGGLTGIVFIMHFYNKISNLAGWTLIFLCFMASSFIDLDHFVAARSFKLYAATNISERPFMHCTTIPLLLLVIFVLASMLQYFHTSLILGILCCAFFTHHTRDAARRGYWIYPIGHTDRVPNVLYLLLTIITPYVMIFLYGLCRGAFTQATGIKNYERIGEDNNRLSVV